MGKNLQQFIDTLKAQLAKARAKVARLEAEAAPLRAALRRFMACAGHGGKSVDCICPACGLARAALSSDAGKGWVSPEVRAQAAAAIDAALHRDLVFHPHGVRGEDDCDCKLCMALCAALDALKEVE